MDGAETKLPTSAAQIVINLDFDRLSTTGPDGEEFSAVRAGFAPIASTSVRLDRCEQRRTAGIVLCPAATAAVARYPVDALGLLVDMERLWGRSANRLIEAALTAPSGLAALDQLETELLRLWSSNHIAPDAACQLAIQHLRAGAPVAHTAALVGVSHTTLTRRFRTVVGRTPKQYQRLLRLERVIDHARGVASDWAEIAASCGYHDQPHLAHEFKELTGLTPGRWSRSVTENPFHVPDRRLFTRHAVAESGTLAS